MKDFAVVIPAYNPMDNLDEFVEALLDQGVAQVIVVNDASDAKYEPMFAKIDSFPRAVVINHAKNRGKGYALRTACQYYLSSGLKLSGMVSADSDGQHLIEDILRVGEVLVEKQVDYVFGERNLHEDHVPKRSLIGNSISSKLFGFLYGFKLQDTQTGLRAWSHEEVAILSELPGDRFEYEINMLIRIAQEKKTLACVDIVTVYHKDHTSHYNTIQDSLKIGLQLFSGIFKSI